MTRGSVVCMGMIGLAAQWRCEDQGVRSICFFIIFFFLAKLCMHVWHTYVYATIIYLSTYPSIYPFICLYHLSIHLYIQSSINPSIYLSIYSSLHNLNHPIHDSPTPTTLSPLVSKCLFSMSVFLFPLCKQIHLYHLSRSLAYALIYDICFSLSAFPYSVHQSLGPTTPLQMTHFHSFIWPSNIPLCVCTTSSLSFTLLTDIQVVSMSWLL